MTSPVSPPKQFSLPVSKSLRTAAQLRFCKRVLEAKVTWGYERIVSEEKVKEAKDLLRRQISDIPGADDPAGIRWEEARNGIIAEWAESESVDLRDLIQHLTPPRERNRHTDEELLDLATKLSHAANAHVYGFVQDETEHFPEEFNGSGRSIAITLVLTHLDAEYWANPKGLMSDTPRNPDRAAPPAPNTGLVF